MVSHSQVFCSYRSYTGVSGWLRKSLLLQSIITQLSGLILSIIKQSIRGINFERFKM